MMKRIYFLGLLLMLSINQKASADWATISAEELEQQSDLIVVGELVEESIEAQTEDDQMIKLGRIQISEVLKGDDQAGLVSLRLPMLAEGRVLSSTDVVFKVGDQGLWYLQAQGDHYFVERPDRFIPLAEAAERIQQLRCYSP